jgi:hypothetical protein
MTRYGVDKVLWRLQRADERARFMADPASVMDGCELTDAEQAALTARDAGSLYSMGAHPFLLWGALFDLAGRAPEYRAQYTEAISPHGYPDHAT